VPATKVAEHTPTERTEGSEAKSPVVLATSVAGCAHDDQANRGHNSTLTCHARHDSGWLCPRRPSEQRP
jgi:hypothetical protein